MCRRSEAVNRQFILPEPLIETCCTVDLGYEFTHMHVFDHALA